MEDILEEEFKELMANFRPRFGNDYDIEIVRLLSILGKKARDTEIKSRIVHYLKNRV